VSNNSPITPPPELVEQWREKWSAVCGPFGVYIATKAAQWGADQELEACCKVICNSATNFSATAHLEAQRRSDELRAARRPKPPSLKEQAVEALGPEPLPVTAPMGDTILNKNIIERHRLLHRALEALPND
jgi:hypothetical protein